MICLHEIIGITSTEGASVDVYTDWTSCDLRLGERLGVFGMVFGMVCTPAPRISTTFFEVEVSEEEVLDRPLLFCCSLVLSVAVDERNRELV